MSCAWKRCQKQAVSRGYCATHYTYARRTGVIHRTNDRYPTAARLLYRPRYPKRIMDALHDLAETPGLTLETYEREKARILADYQPPTHARW